MEWTSAAVACSLLLFFPALARDAIAVSDFNQEVKDSIRMPKGENEGVPEVHCSRERSRAARDIIEEYLMPFVDREKYEFPNSCRIHPDNDMFGEQENHKIHVDEKEWRCGYCKKSFLSEKYLDQHLDTRHYNLLNVSQARCLADLCGALHCDFYTNPKSPRKCNPAAAARNRLLCESLADSCFRVSQGLSASRLHGTSPPPCLENITCFASFPSYCWWFGHFILIRKDLTNCTCKDLTNLITAASDVVHVCSFHNMLTARVVYAPILRSSYLLRRKKAICKRWYEAK